MKTNVRIAVASQRNYRSAKGNTTFVYTLTNATADQLEAFKAVQGDFFRTEDNKPEGKALWFTTTYIGAKGHIIITANGKCVPDMSAFDQAASLAKQFGGNLGVELAKTAALQLLGVAPTPEVVSAPAVGATQPGDIETV